MALVYNKNIYYMFKKLNINIRKFVNIENYFSKKIDWQKLELNRFHFSKSQNVFNHISHNKALLKDVKYNQKARKT